MSIILEALKKASVTKNTAPVNAEATVRIREEKVEVKKDGIHEDNGFNLSKTMLMGVAAVVTVGTVAFLMFPQAGTLEGDKVPAGPVSSAADKTKTVAEGYSTTPLPAAHKQDTASIGSFITKLSNPHLSLNGVVYGIGKPAAIIENKILEEGASIKGAKVVKIRKDSVEMLDEVTGQPFVLKLD